MARPSSPVQAAALEGLTFLNIGSPFYSGGVLTKSNKDKIEKGYTLIFLLPQPILNHFFVLPTPSLGTPVITSPKLHISKLSSKKKRSRINSLLFTHTLIIAVSYLPSPLARPSSPAQVAAFRGQVFFKIGPLSNCTGVLTQAIRN